MFNLFGNSNKLIKLENSLDSYYERSVESAIRETEMESLLPMSIKNSILTFHKNLNRNAPALAKEQGLSLKEVFTVNDKCRDKTLNKYLK